MVEHRWARDIIGVPTMAVLYEYVELWEAPENVSLQPSAGSSIWKWTESGQYTALSAYRSFIGRTVLLGAKELWKACVPPKVKFFLWLAIHGRL
jgi:hypothetical protein